MECIEYAVGDRVASLVDRPDGNTAITIGTTGTVCCIEMSRIGVRWDFEKPYPYEVEHSCNGNCEPGYGWYIDAINLEPVPDLSIEEVEDSELEMILRAGGNNA